MDETATGFRIGLDLGGTKTEIVTLDATGGEALRRRLPSRPTYADTLALVKELVTWAEDRLATRATVGVGIPGTLSPATGRVKNANSTWLIGRPLDRDLSRELGRPVRLANDANCFALSEATDGAGAGARVVFGVILGTGVGGGIVIDGRIHEGPQGIAGEWGHIPLPWPRPEELPGPVCYCGRRGCIETFCSGPGMARDHRLHTGMELDPREIALEARRGDEDCARTLERHADRVARGLAVVVDILDPDVVVLGGGLSNLPDLDRSIARRMGGYLFTDEARVRIVPNRHGDSGGVRGAAWLWP